MEHSSGSPQDLDRCYTQLGMIYVKLGCEFCRQDLRDNWGQWINGCDVI